MQGLAHWRTPDRIPELFKHGWGVRYTELSPTGSETSGTDRQSEIVAAINGPITHLLLLKGEKVQ